MRPDLQLSQLVCARLCHDLGGAVGTLAGVLDLVEGEGEAITLGRDTANELRRRLQLYSAAWGSPREDMTAAAVAELLAGSPAAQRVQFDLSGLAPGPFSGEFGRLLLNAALLGAEALPRGGQVAVAGGPESAVTITPSGRSVAWPAALPAAIAAPGTVPDGGPRQVIAPLLLLLAMLAGRDVALAGEPAVLTLAAPAA